MRPNNRSYAARRRWWPPSPALITGAVVVLGLIVLWGSGLIDPAKFGFGQVARPSVRGLIPVPASAAMIPAYTKITRDHVWNPKLGELSVVYVNPNQVSPDMMVKLADLLGRVLDHDKPPGYVFTESDFLPKGTRPGLVAGIPAGKRAIRVDSEKVYGLQGLRRGDRFDLLSTLAIDAPKSGQGLNFGGGVYSQQMDLQARITNWQKQATVRVVVQNGTIVEPVTVRNVPISTNSLTQGAITRTRPIQEVVIAIDPGEIAHLTEALAVEAKLTCVPRSGRPEDSPLAPTPSLTPRSPFSSGALGASSPTGGAGLTTIESITGTKREIIAAPSQK